MENVQVVIIGGFLGAGKTTSMIAMARMLSDNGKKVAVITNDQTDHLVDSAYVERQNFRVEEVTGACFCCNFNVFAEKLQKLDEEFHPDVILAEPVGSCTDLVATIMKPIRTGKAGDFLLSPLSVLVEPRRLDAMMKTGHSAFGIHQGDVRYLFLKQIEEADLIVINKVDMVSEKMLETYKSYLRQCNPSAKVLCVSAKSSVGFEDWILELSVFPEFDKQSLDIVYDIYARAEAALGWLNTSAGISGNEAFDGTAFIMGLAGKVKKQLEGHSMEIAHMKMYIVGDEDYAKLSCVSIDEDIVVDHPMGGRCTRASVIINIRAACEPDFLKEVTEAALLAQASQEGVVVNKFITECFQPGYPNPVYRMG